MFSEIALYPRLSLQDCGVFVAGVARFRVDLYGSQSFFRHAEVEVVFQMLRNRNCKILNSWSRSQNSICKVLSSRVGVGVWSRKMLKRWSRNRKKLSRLYNPGSKLFVNSRLHTSLFGTPRFWTGIRIFPERSGL